MTRSDEELSLFCVGRRLTDRLECPSCNATGMDLRVVRGQKLTQVQDEVRRYYQRMECLVCRVPFIYWYEKKRSRRRQPKLPAAVGASTVAPLTEEEKLRRWVGG